MHTYTRALADYERNYQEEPLSFEETEELANEYDDDMCALADEACDEMRLSGEW